ncbi:MAG: ABC transporter substrate-binding protein [Candidatus Methylomirabilia bacterium]
MKARVLIVLAVAALLIVPFWQQAAAIQRGGVLTWFDYADPARLDIHSESPLGVQQAVAGIYSSLLQYNPDDPTKIIPDLATRYEASADGLTYTFHLRKGVKWHDGKPFTSADVKVSLDRVLDPKFRSPRCGAMLKPLVASVEAVDPHTVQVRLKFPAAPFIPSIASAWCRIAAKHVLEKYGDLKKPEAQIGTGPFKFKRYVRGSVIEWERNPDYFIKGLPYLDGVKQYILKGKSTMLAAAKAGRVVLWDTWPPMSKTIADELKAARGDTIELYRWPINVVWMVHMNATKPPFNNKDLRRAVHLGLDRAALIDKGLEGAGVPCAVLDPKLVGEFALPLAEVQKIPGCRQDKKAEDIAEAKRLVEKHYPGGLDIEVVVRTVGNYVDRVQVVLAQLRKIGIRGTLRTYESAAGYGVYGKGAFIMLGTQDTAMVVADPSSAFSILYTTRAGRNWEKFSDPKIDELAEKGLRERDHAKRVQIYHELQRYILTRDSGAVPISWVEGWFFKDKRVQNYNPANTIYDNSTFMKVWLKK